MRRETFPPWQERYTAVWRQHWAVFVGLIVGALILPGADDAWQKWRFEREREAEQSTPVVVASGKIVERTATSVLIHITGTKLRECRFMGLQAYTVDTGGVMTAAQLERVGVPMMAHSRPLGPFDAGTFRVWPLVDDARGVTIYVSYQCGVHEVRALLAQVALNDNR